MGAGSIGTRRARILAEMGHEVSVTDLDHDKALVAASQHENIRAVSGGQGRGLAVDLVMICTPPDSGRAGQVHDALKWLPRAIFIEKPIALDEDTVYRVMDALAGEDVFTHGACNLRYCPEVATIRDMDIRFLTLRMGQHSSYWSKNHKPCTLALDSIHELDLACYIMGKADQVHGISTNDYARLNVAHVGDPLSIPVSSSSTLVLDRVTSPPVRWVEYITEAGVLGRVNLTTGDEMYRREMEHMIVRIEGRGAPLNSVLDAGRLCIEALWSAA